MQHGAYADICGNLEKIIIINGINNKYGIIFITVDQKKMFDDPSYIWRGIYRSNCIPVFLWGQDVLDKFQHISSSEMVWTVGRLEKLDALLFENVSRYINCIPTTIITDLRQQLIKSWLNNP
jgi:hypothetical protein